jgi:hypothetical protein
MTVAAQDGKVRGDIQRDCHVFGQRRDRAEVMRLYKPRTDFIVTLRKIEMTGLTAGAMYALG